MILASFINILIKQKKTNKKTNHLPDIIENIQELTRYYGDKYKIKKTKIENILLEINKHVFIKINKGIYCDIFKK